MSKSKQSDNKTNEQFISEIRSLFEVTNTRHKQDKDFLKKFTMLIKKEKLNDKKVIVNEILNLFKLAANQKGLYFNTIIDGLLLLQSKEININAALSEAIKGPCQIDKKSKENQDHDEIKLFCFQKLEIAQIESQFNLSKVTVFMEKVLKQISSHKNKEETKNVLQFLNSINEILSQQLQLQSLICILILKIVLTLTRDSVPIKSDMKVFFSLIDENNIHLVFKCLITVAKTTYTHNQYHYIFKSCLILMSEICIKNKMSVIFQTFLCNPQSQVHLKTIFNLVKEFNFSLYSEHKDQSFLYEKPRFVIDYLPTNFCLSVLHYNPGNWMSIQNFIQKNIKISDYYLNFTIANLAQRQSKIVDLGQMFRKNQLSKKSMNQVDQLLIDSMQQQQDIGDYNSYIYCQLHMLLYLQSYDLTSSYFKKSQISCDSKFFKRLLLLRFEDKLYKYQETTKIQKPRLGTNQYFTYQINKLLKQLSSPISQDQIKRIYQDIKQMLNTNYHFQSPFITKFSSYIKVLFKDLVNSFLNESLYAFDYQQYFGLIQILSLYSKQAFQALIFSIFNSLLKLKKPHPVAQKLTDFQICALEEVGVMFDEMRIEDSLMQQMIVASLQFFTTLEIKKNPKLNLFVQILERLKNYIKVKSSSQESVLKQYKQLILMALDRFLMMNGLHAQSMKNPKSKFRVFFETHLAENIDMIEILLIITKHLKVSDISKYLESLGECYLQSLITSKNNRSLKFKLCAYILYNHRQTGLIYLEQNMKDPTKLYELLYQFHREKSQAPEQPPYSSRKKLIQLFLRESQHSKLHYNCLLKILK